MAIVTSRALSPFTIYPESDGKPMAESDIHRDQMIYLIEALKDHFQNDPQVYVAGNLFVYYEEGNPEAVVAPDTLVIFGVSKRKRRVYKVWEEGKGPDIVFEVTSKSTRWEDVGTKRGIYAYLGVQEYILFDPLGEYLHLELQGYRLSGGDYLPIPHESASDGTLRLYSEVLELVLQAEQGWLWLYKSGTEEKLLSPQEAQAARRVAEARVLKEAEARRLAEAQVRQEAEARRLAEEEVARLRSELERLRSRG